MKTTIDSVERGRGCPGVDQGEDRRPPRSHHEKNHGKHLKGASESPNPCPNLFIYVISLSSRHSFMLQVILFRMSNADVFVLRNVSCFVWSPFEPLPPVLSSCFCNHPPGLFGQKRDGGGAGKNSLKLLYLSDDPLDPLLLLLPDGEHPPESFDLPL